MTTSPPEKAPRSSPPAEEEDEDDGVATGGAVVWTAAPGRVVDAVSAASAWREVSDVLGDTGAWRQD